MHPIHASFDSHCHYHISTKDSSKPYQNSLALHTQQTPRDIISNRQSLTLSSTALEFVVAHQTHSDKIEIVQSASGWKQASTLECDGLITPQKNLVLSILTADCVPILLYDPINEVIGAIHAGWKGTHLKIVQKAIAKMQSAFGSDSKDIFSYIAPSIGKCCYEVGSDVAKHFQKESYIKKGEKFMLNLPYDNEKQLLEMGVSKKNITFSNICTACEVNRFFSYRKECGCSGRFMSMIWMES